MKGEREKEKESGGLRGPHTPCATFGGGKGRGRGKRPSLTSVLVSMGFRTCTRREDLVLRRESKLPNHPGVVLYRKARSTGTHVGLYRSYESGFESDPEWPWSTVCDEHGGIVCHATRKAAETFLSHPEDWCPTCKDERID